MKADKLVRRGAEDEGDKNEEEIPEFMAAESSTTFTTESTVPAATDQFMHTPGFRIHFMGFVPVDVLMALRVATKGWNAAADVLINEGVESGTMIVHGRKDISEEVAEALEERRALATRAIFFLNITKVGHAACFLAINLVVVESPEGVKSIGSLAFCYCKSLTTVFFPKTLTPIGEEAFYNCCRLDNADLLHTNLQRRVAFMSCLHELPS
ncbi:hypothetical protein TL16_g10366 [Triparma laevis f. inornata]|uniref:Uncharacterized protein n=1 Tax=Triparma laevis f. inornata TaxID=1714386 RepID=A0A9W7B8M2_9STRA|nr:hypothetical protein TL16_g10366 [Triparma laevis f. inornata]